MWKVEDHELPVYKGATLTKRMDPSCDEEGLEMQSKPYAQVIGNLMYVVLCTRPDLGFAISLGS